MYKSGRSHRGSIPPGSHCPLYTPTSLSAWGNSDRSCPTWDSSNPSVPTPSTRASALTTQRENEINTNQSHAKKIKIEKVDASQTRQNSHSEIANQQTPPSKLPSFLPSIHPSRKNPTKPINPHPPSPRKKKKKKWNEEKRQEKSNRKYYFTWLLVSNHLASTNPNKPILVSTTPTFPFQTFPNHSVPTPQRNGTETQRHENHSGTLEKHKEKRCDPSVPKYV